MVEIVVNAAGLGSTAVVGLWAALTSHHARNDWGG
jgi:hypothetical protein